MSTHLHSPRSILPRLTRLPCFCPPAPPLPLCLFPYNMLHRAESSYWVTTVVGIVWRCVFVFKSGHCDQITCSLLGGFSKPITVVTQ